MRGFVVETKVSTKRDNSDVTLYIRDDQEVTHAITIDHPHLSVSKELEVEAYNPNIVISDLSRKFRSFYFQRRDLSSTKYVIHALGPRNLRHSLPGEKFYVKDSLPDGRSPEFNSPTRHLRYMYPPGSIVEIFGNEVFRTGTTISAEQLFSQKIVALDVELKDWKTGKGSVSNVILYTGDPDNNLLFTVFDPKQEYILDTRIIVCKDQEELVSRAAQAERKYGSFWITGHNVSNDKRWLRDNPEFEVYTPGVDNTRPLVKYARKIGKEENARIETIKMITPGRQTADTYRYGKNNMGFLIDDRLVTHFSRTGDLYEKIINYDELDELNQLAENGDYLAARTILQYTVEDGQKTFLLGKRMIKNIARKVVALGIDADTLSSKLRNSLANDYWKRNAFEKRGTYREASSYVKKFIFREGNPDTVDNTSIEDKSLEMLLLHGLKDVQKQNGAFEKVHAYYLAPFMQAFSPIIKQKRGLFELYKALRSEEDSDLKFDLARTINSHMMVPFLEMEAFFKRSGRLIGKYIYKSEDLEGNPGADFAFGKTYGLAYTEFGKNNNYWQMNQNIHYALHGFSVYEGLVPGLIKSEVINFNKNFFFVKDRKPLKDAELLGSAFHLGECGLVSSDNRMVANLGSSLIYQGFAKGGKTNSRPAMLLVHRALRNHFSGLNPHDNYVDYKSHLAQLEEREKKYDIEEKTEKLFGGVLSAIMPIRIPQQLSLF